MVNYSEGKFDKADHLKTTGKPVFPRESGRSLGEQIVRDIQRNSLELF